MSGMFGGGTNNAYDEIVAKTTDENLTSENWELILNLCDKVQDEGSEGARSVVASLLKRLSHRNPNVQLYTLSLTDALSKNCGLSINREIASRAFTAGLEKLVVDRNTHDKVRKRTLALIAEWTAEWEKQEELGIMEECYNSLKTKNYKFETQNEPPPPAVDDEIRRKEEEELQRVLEMSMQDRGGYNSYSSWNQPTGAGSSSSATNVSSSSGTGGSFPNNGYVPSSNAAASTHARSPSPKAVPASTASTASGIASAMGSMTLGSTTSLTSIGSQGKHLSNRVRALHAFSPTEPGELGFSAGDIITVVDRGYKDWWRGQLRGRTGIFPVNYVEVLPPPDEAELAREAQQEAAVFAEATNVERLLEMLREMDKQQQQYATSQAQGTSVPAPDRLADNDDLQELYRSCMALRPKIVKLIEKYSQKRADLVSMNETFVRARGIFERLMEDSLASYGGAYQAGYGSGPGGYAYFPTPAPAGYSAPAATGPYPQQPYPGPAHATSPTPTPGQQPLPGYGQQYPAQQRQPEGYEGYGRQQQPGPQQVHTQQGMQGGYQYGTPQGPVNNQPQQVQPVQQQVQPVQQQQPSVQQQVQPVQQQPVQQQAQPVQQQAQPVQQQVQSVQQQQQPTQQSQPAQQITQQTQPQQQPAGPPYVYDPKATYGDSNVQAWAQYYAQGGTDLTGAVYFISVPGIKEADPSAGASASQAHSQAQTLEQNVQGASAPVQVQQQQQQPPDHQQGAAGYTHPSQALPQQQSLTRSATLSSLKNPHSEPQNQQGPSPYDASPARQNSFSGSTSSLPYPGLDSNNPSRSATLDSADTTSSFPNPYGPDSASSGNMGYPVDAQPNTTSSGLSLGSSLTFGGHGVPVSSAPSITASAVVPAMAGSPHSAHSTHSFQVQQLQHLAQSPASAGPGSSSSPGYRYAGVQLSDGPSPSSNASLPLSDVGGSAATTNPSPPISNSTPSWVLPKMAPAPGPFRA